jgi:hypothetical protein
VLARPARLVAGTVIPPDRTRAAPGQVAQEFKHRLISELSIGTIPARIFQPLLANIYFYEIDTPQAVRGVASQSRTALH